LSLKRCILIELSFMMEEVVKVSEVTRRDIIDAIVLEELNWSGRLEEQEFLGRLFDLRSLPSNDQRFQDADGDIWQHRVRNNDWDDDWIFYDRRFNLLNGDDEVFLRFLCETIHPAVRSDPTEVERLSQLYNQFLQKDGYHIVEKTRLSGRPVFIARHLGDAGTPGVSAAWRALTGMDAGYVMQQITRMEAAVENDPSLAIGTAKELVETCCKTILDEHGSEVQRSMDLPQLVKSTSSKLDLIPEGLAQEGQARDTIKRLLSNLVECFVNP
jgi:hypothetical protein